MIEFKQLNDDDPALVHSPMVRALEKTFGYILEHGGIDLTPSKAFKRVFVQWAAAAFDWPGFTETDLYAVNKVLNEIDFRPLVDLHDLMIALGIGRHFKGRFRLTKAGRALSGRPGRMFGIVAPFYLFEVDHLLFSRTGERPLGNWDIFLNVLNVEAEDGATGAHIRRSLYGEPGPDDPYDRLLGSLYVQVLRPLCWTGLLHEDRIGGFRAKDRIFTKTPLWRAALELSTDDAVHPATRH